MLFFLAGLIETVGFSHYLNYNFRLLQEFGLNAAEVRQWVGILGSLTFLLGLPLAPFWGTWADRYSRKLIITRSALIEAAFFTMIALSHSLPQLLASASLAGFVLGNTGVMFAVMSEVAPKNRVGLSLALTGAASPLGFAVGPLMGGLLINGITLGHFSFTGISLRSLLMLDGTLSLLAGLALIALFHEPPHLRVESGESILHQVWSAISAVLRSPILGTLFSVAVMGYMGQRLMTSYLPLFVAKMHTGPGLERVIGLIAGTSSAALGLLAPVWGAAGDRVGHARLFPVSVAGASVAFVALSLTHTLGQLAVVWVILGALQAGINPLFYTMVASHTPESQRSTVLAFAYVPLYLGGIIGPAIGAELARLNLPVQSCALVAALVLAAATVAAARSGIRRSRAPMSG